MTSITLPAMQFALLTSALLATSAVRIDFDTTAVGSLPAGFETCTTRVAAGGRWEVVADNHGRALAQLDGGETSRRFAMALAPGTFRDFVVSVRLRPVAGREDQAGGLVWRWQDHDNYYLARTNALERNLRLYRVVNGNRIEMAGAEELVLETGVWQTLKVEQRGSSIRVSLDGEKRLEAEDETFADAGRIGVWTKSDSVTWFDDLDIEEVRK